MLDKEAQRLITGIKRYLKHLSAMQHSFDPFIILNVTIIVIYITLHYSAFKLKLNCAVPLPTCMPWQ